MTLSSTTGMALDDTILDQLAAQVRAHPPLPEPEVGRLLAGARDHPQGSAREQLIRHHMSLALDAALARRGPHDDVAELFQEASLAVVAAIDAYLGGTGNAGGLLPSVRSATQEQVDHARDHQRQLREDAEAFVRDTRLLDMAQVALESMLGRWPTTEELASKLEWTSERVELLTALLEDAQHLDDESLLPYLEGDEQTGH